MWLIYLVNTSTVLIALDIHNVWGRNRPLWSVNYLLAQVRLWNCTSSCVKSTDSSPPLFSLVIIIWVSFKYRLGWANLSSCRESKGWTLPFFLRSRCRRCWWWQAPRLLSGEQERALPWGRGPQHHPTEPGCSSDVLSPREGGWQQGNWLHSLISCFPAHSAWIRFCFAYFSTPWNFITRLF